MSSDSEEPGESRSDRSCRCGEVRALGTALNAALDSGATFQDPSSVYISSESFVDKDAWIGAGSHILGKSRIGRNAKIGPNAIIEDSLIGDGAIVQPFSTVSQNSNISAGALVKSRSEIRGSHVAGTAEIGPNALVEESSVASGAKVGPFCRVRSGSTVNADAYIGTQAEIKASRVGAGSKVGHFSFIGDAELGNDVNIGAGAITANYDGSNVQKTVIADGVSIGAGCVLIAPIRIGTNAKTGAGAVVTRDVMDGELVLGVPARVKAMGSMAA